MLAVLAVTIGWRIVAYIVPVIRIFDVASLISIISEAITLEPGDILVTGTPAGVGMARKPQLFMKHGDVCEVELEGVGILSNVVADDVIPAQAVNQ